MKLKLAYFTYFLSNFTTQERTCVCLLLSILSYMLAQHLHMTNILLSPKQTPLINTNPVSLSLGALYSRLNTTLKPAHFNLSKYFKVSWSYLITLLRKQLNRRGYLLTFQSPCLHVEALKSLQIEFRLQICLCGDSTMHGQEALTNAGLKASDSAGSR